MSQSEREVDRSIHGVAKTVAGVLANQKYAIDYYQRDHEWESKQVAEPVADLTTKSLDLKEPAHVRKDVAEYPGYYDIIERGNLYRASVKHVWNPDDIPTVAKGDH